jgi:predicted dithiol-disulfide oxidoreductase (DUF899 family)
MDRHTVGTREEWLTARLDLLEAEKELTRYGDELARQDGAVYHTYSAYARGCDALWGMWQWLDRAPSGRNEGDMSWFHRHDEYR